MAPDPSASAPASHHLHPGEALTRWRLTCDHPPEDPAWMRRDHTGAPRPGTCWLARRWETKGPDSLDLEVPPIVAFPLPLTLVTTGREPRLVTAWAAPDDGRDQWAAALHAVVAARSGAAAPPWDDLDDDARAPYRAIVALFPAPATDAGVSDLGADRVLDEAWRAFISGTADRRLQGPGSRRRRRSR